MVARAFHGNDLCPPIHFDKIAAISTFVFPSVFTFGIPEGRTLDSAAEKNYTECERVRECERVGKCERVRVTENKSD